MEFNGVVKGMVIEYGLMRIPVDTLPFMKRLNEIKLIFYDDKIKVEFEAVVKDNHLLMSIDNIVMPVYIFDLFEKYDGFCVTIIWDEDENRKRNQG